MDAPIIAFRRDLPGGRIIMITVEQLAPNDVRGELRVERRADPERRRAGQPPLLAEVRAHSQKEVLAILRRIEADDQEILERLARWDVDRAPLPVELRARKDGE